MAGRGLLRPTGNARVDAPPRAFRMNGRELARYLPLAMISAPLIHVLFSFFLGWNEYMPFIQVPSMQALLKSFWAC